MRAPVLTRGTACTAPQSTYPLNRGSRALRRKCIDGDATRIATDASGAYLPVGADHCTSPDTTMCRSVEDENPSLVFDFGFDSLEVPFRARFTEVRAPAARPASSIPRAARSVCAAHAPSLP